MKTRNNITLGVASFRNRLSIRLLRVALTILFTLIALPSVFAQGLGSISGTINDPTGAMVPSVTVTATRVDEGTTSTVTANDLGFYVFPSLPPSTYTLSVVAPGFQKYVQSGVVLQADQSVTVSIALHVGSSSETITVEANTVQVDTTTGTLSQVIDGQRVNDLPLNGRNVAALTTLVAGAVLAPNGGADQGQTKTFPAAVTISINGSSADQTSFMLDGGNNIDEYTNVNAPFPFPDALQEFSVQTSNYNAEYGQNSGGVVNIITKSGGSKLHGNIFEYVRNGAFNARNYFASTVDPLKRNQFGGTLGGPIIIPHLVSGKHTFFFFGDQKTIIRDQQGGQSAFVPTQANLNGDFSALLNSSSPNNPLGRAVQIINPYTNVAYLNNQIPTTSFDPAAVAVARELPSVNGNGVVFYQKPIVQNYNEYVIRIDHQLRDADRFFVRYYQNHFTNGGALDRSNLLTYSDQADIRVQNALISETHTFSSKLLNNLIVSYAREVSQRGPLPGAPNPASFGVNIYQPPQKSIQLIASTGFFQFGDNPQATFQRNNYTGADDLHWVMGRHNFAFGVHAEVSKVDINSLANQSGNFTFNSNTTQYALASFLLGYMFQFSQGSGQYFNNRNTFIGVYGQDSWQISKRLSLNYGLRYEPFSPWKEIQGRMEQFNPAAFAAGTTSIVYKNAPPGLLFPGDSGVPAYGVRPVYSNIEPRVGFAFDVFGDGNTSVRGGAGVFYDSRLPGILNGNQANTTPFSVTVALTQPKGPFSNPYLGISNPFPAPFPAPSNVIFPTPVQAFSYDPSGNFQVPATYSWNLTVEQKLTNRLASRIAYVGSHASHVLTNPEINPSIYVPGSSLSTNQRRLYPGYSNIVIERPSGSSHYHSLQASLQQRVTNGLSVLANYTFSKSLDDIPYNTGATGFSVSQSYVYPVTQPNFKSLDIGPSAFDRQSVFSASYLWTLPRLERGNKVLRSVVNGWQTTGILQAQSGAPLTITAGADISQTGLLQDRAQHGGQPAYGPGACKAGSACVNYLNPASFSLPAIGTFGNVVKGSFRGPGYFDWDSGLIRDFAFREIARLEFRAEYFNLLNHTNLGSPVTTVSSGGFGSIVSANDPRIAQLALKLAF
jgi:Carboxypeptidase regulatory-like domain